MLKDPDVATEVGSESIRGVWRGKNEAKRSVKVRALKAMRNRVLTENMKQEGNVFYSLRLQHGTWREQVNRW